MTLQDVAQELDIDLVPALDRVVNNKALYIRLLKVFMEETYLDTAKKALEEGIYQEAEDAVHSVKGSAATLGMKQMEKNCHIVVAALRSEQITAAKEAFPEVEKEFSHICETIEKLEEDE